MAAINFPDDPEIGQQHEENGKTFEWNGTAWKLIGVGSTSVEWDNIVNKPDLGTAVFQDVGDFATASQGSKADSAVQPGDLPVFGSAAQANVEDFASAAQGELADSAIQLEDLTDNQTLQWIYADNKVFEISGITATRINHVILDGITLVPTTHYTFDIVNQLVTLTSSVTPATGRVLQVNIEHSLV